LKRRFKTHLRKKYVSEEETPFVKHAFLQQQDRYMSVQETNSHRIISHTRGAENVIVVKRKSGRRRMQS
jgi:hypothetical protein